MSMTTMAADRPGPGRPREFDLNDAVRDAIEVFRAHGYHGASLRDLTDGTGLARGSLYKAFHDKRSLFLAALDHYTAASLGRLGEALAQPGPVRAAIRAALIGYGERAATRKDKAGGGCLVTVAAMEMMPQDEEVGVLINRMFRRMQDLFAAAVIRGQASGEIARDIDERAVARMLVCTIQGLRVLGKTGPTAAEIAGIADLTLKSLD